ncbi:hypothetical protein N7539_008421 [Penicillium diatomitis]|uniref:Uncharacterized protein n=1 Tax=Penicillium diatomitis TaxID=2819901 RepID=A0A9W9WTS7_9EURO|nr:uncharacterized protein N7539_008421 [Penicillium diatomitis]KAJ5475355.1 hypothetical protein N7539_008421 [Penicillium diatomitis]
MTAPSPPQALAQPVTSASALFDCPLSKIPLMQVAGFRCRPLPVGCAKVTEESAPGNGRCRAALLRAA